MSTRLYRAAASTRLQHHFAAVAPLSVRRRSKQRPVGTASAKATMAANGTATNGVHDKKAATSLHDEHSVVLVLDYGSQYTQLICRRIREIGVFSMMFPGDASMVGAASAAAAAALQSKHQQQQLARLS